MSGPQMSNAQAGGVAPRDEQTAVELGRLSTEQRNERTTELDSMSIADTLAVMNSEDQSVALAVREALPQIGEAVRLIADSLHAGGRLIYLGAGTSGRIGLLDAVECPPTFNTAPGQVLALLAGGPRAFRNAAEGIEDNPQSAVADIDEVEVGGKDTVVGLAASGRTPYVIAGLDRARERGAATVSVACNRNAACSPHADIAIEVDTGPEVLTGSTRLKAGTAQKLVCNMLSTAAMVRAGKTFSNLMIDLQPTNAKLVDRAQRIVAAAAGVDLPTAATALEAAAGDAKVATVMLAAGVDAPAAIQRLAAAGGLVRCAITPATGG
jgi:N-acetylmuramic acid 6-phosphate etherase